MTWSVATTHATGMGPLPDLLDAQGGSKAVERAFRAVDLPLDVATDRSQRVPLRSMVELFDRAAQISGDPFFGLKVGTRMAPTDYGLWVRYAIQAPTLREALSRVSRSLILHQVGGALFLYRRPGGLVVWGYRQEALPGTVAENHDEHVFPSLLAFVRLFLGPAWTPHWVESSQSDRRRNAGREDLTGLAWHIGVQGVGLVFDETALDATNPLRPDPDEVPMSHEDLEMEILSKAAERPIDRVTAIMSMRLVDRSCDIDGVAQSVGLSRRSLQRLIEGEGTTYTALLDRVRMSRARALICETKLTLSEIAFVVGYSDPAHFSRAFRRCFGFPPSALRKPAPA